MVTHENRLNTISSLTKFEVCQLRQVPRGTQLVENVVVAFARRLENNSRLLKQVSPHTGALNVVLPVEVDLNELAEP